MPSCREIDALVTPYIDDEVTAPERAVVEAHLAACPPCRHRAAVEVATRRTLRTRLCRPCAPEQLRSRCLEAAAHTFPGRFRTPNLSLISFSIGAGLVALTGGVLLYSLTGLSPTVLAAQLTLDHLACFATHSAVTPVDERVGEQQFARDYGWPIDLPEADAAGLQLVGVRRCFCGEGAAAHAMYRFQGRPVSLYIIPDADGSRATAEVFGYDAVIWSRQGTTYVLLGTEPSATLQHIASRLTGIS
jgi:anti-sigma factor RsiW